MRRAVATVMSIIVVLAVLGIKLANAQHGPEQKIGEVLPLEVEDGSMILYIIVPLRDREFQVPSFTDGILRYLQSQRGLRYVLLFVEQSVDGLFNRGALLNAGYTLLTQTRQAASRAESQPVLTRPHPRVCFHDIDYLPLDAAAFQPYLRNESFQLAVNASCKPDVPPFVTGRIVCMSSAAVERAGGWADDYWGWGFEDADFDLRLLLAGEPVRRVPADGRATHGCVEEASELAFKRAAAWRKAEAVRFNLDLFAVRKASAHVRAAAHTVRAHVLSVRTVRKTTQGQVLHAHVSLVDGMHRALVHSMAAYRVSSGSHLLPPPPRIQSALQRCLRGLGGCAARPLPLHLQQFLDAALEAFHRTASKDVSEAERAEAWAAVRVPSAMTRFIPTRYVSRLHRIIRRQPRVFVTGLPRAGTDWVALLASLPLAERMGLAHNKSLEQVLRAKHFISCRPGCLREPFNPHTRSLFELCDQVDRLPKERNLDLRSSPFTSQYQFVDADADAQLTAGRWLDHVLQLCIHERRRQDGVHPNEQSLVIKDPNGFFATGWLAARYRAKVIVMLRSPPAWLASMERAGWDQLDGCNRKSLPHCAKDVLLRQLASAHDHTHGMGRELVPADAIAMLRAATGWGRLARNALFLRVFYHACTHYQARHHEWWFVRQEDALTRPRAFLDELAAHIGLPPEALSEHVVAATVASTQSNGGTTRYSSRRVFGTQPTAWRAELTASALVLAFNLTREASSPWYGAAHWWDVHGPAHGTRFADVIEASGLPVESTSFGVSFGDFNGDARPDVFMGFHYTGLRHEHQVFEQPAVYVNEGGKGNGGAPTFRRVRLLDMPGVASRIETNCTGQCFELVRAGDLHGAAWHDYDGDGDQDIFINTGGQGGMGTSPCLFLENDGRGGFVDRAAEFNLTLDELRGRVSVWLDWDADGLSDLLVTAQPGGKGAAGRSVLFRQQHDGSHPSRGSTPRFALAATGTFGLARLYAHPGTDAGVAVIPEGALAKKPSRQAQDGGRVGSATGGGAAETAAQGAARLRDQDRARRERDVCLLHCREWYTHFTYCCAFASEVLGAATTAAATASTAAPGHGRGRGRSASPPLTDGMLNAQLETAGLIGPVLPDGKGLKAGWQQGRVFPTYAVPGDWDNDGDVDIFVVRFLEDRISCLTGSRTSPPNLLLENLGNGSFALAHDAWGAATRRAFGNGDSAAAADVNGDGFLDLVVTHGAGIVYAPGTGRDTAKERQLGTYDIKLHHYTRGPNQLLLNAGDNGNHWLKVRLVGLRSEGGSIGARVSVRASYSVQTRAKTGGGNLMSMSYHELHFGLGVFVECDEVRVVWPSGRVETRRAVAADQTLTLRESDAVDPAEAAPASAAPAANSSRRPRARAAKDGMRVQGSHEAALDHGERNARRGAVFFACSSKKNVYFDRGCTQLPLTPAVSKDEL